MEEDSTTQSISASITEARVISILFPALRRSFVIDTRSDDEHEPMVRIMPQVASFDDRIKIIEALRPRLGKVRAILGIPWLRSLKELEDAHVPDSLVERLVSAGLPSEVARAHISTALRQLRRYEQLAFTRMIEGQGFRTLWSAGVEQS